MYQGNSTMYPSYGAAFTADTAGYLKQHPSGNPYENPIMPILLPVATITAMSSVNVKSVQVGFYDKSGIEASPSLRAYVNQVLTAGQGYTVDPWKLGGGLSNPTNGDTSVASCAVTAWTRHDGT
jgi:hypothetical protein